MKDHWKIQLFAAMLVCLQSLIVSAEDSIYEDARDPWSLQDKSLVNRQLHEQLTHPSQHFRLDTKGSRFAVAVDASTGGQQPLPGTDYAQTRFHGFFILDSYGAIRLFNSLDINLNLNFLNPSFCDGYHKSFQLLAGVSFHWKKSIFTLKKEPVIFHALIMDLDSVTIGSGLLIEQMLLEGFSFSLQWKDHSLSAHIAARVFWDNDDFLAIPLKLFGGKLTLLSAFWYFTESVPENNNTIFDIFRAASGIQEVTPYVGVSSNFDIRNKFHLTAEYLMRIKNHKISNGIMLRGDYKEEVLSKAQFHVGYQFRFYEQGFGPIEEINQASVLPQIPERENIYATNSFEYFSISPWFSQFSHTIMTEFALFLTPKFQLFCELEYWLRMVHNKDKPNKILYVNGDNRAPGIWHNVYYKMGMKYRLFHGLPHRISIFVSNKWIASDTLVTTSSPVRYVTDPLWGFELEVFL